MYKFKLSLTELLHASMSTGHCVAHQHPCWYFVMGNNSIQHTLWTLDLLQQACTVHAWRAMMPNAHCLVHITRLYACCRVPLKNVELETDGSWSSLRRDVSNSWNANGGMYKCPLHIRLTSVLSDVIEDWVPSNQGGQGTGQFPVPTPDAAGATAGALPLTPQYPGEH